MRSGSEPRSIRNQCKRRLDEKSFALKGDCHARSMSGIGECAAVTSAAAIQPSIQDYHQFRRPLDSSVVPVMSQHTRCSSRRKQGGAQLAAFGQGTVREGWFLDGLGFEREKVRAAQPLKLCRTEGFEPVEPREREVWHPPRQSHQY